MGVIILEEIGYCFEWEKHWTKNWGFSTTVGFGEVFIFLSSSVNVGADDGNNNNASDTTYYESFQNFF